MQWAKDILENFGVESSELLNDILVKVFDVLGKASQKILASIVVFIFMRIVVRVGNKIIDRFFKRKTMGKLKIEERRANTLSTILKSVFKYLIYFIGIVTIVGFFVDVRSILAVAGVGGLAISFGAQNLVRDIVTGFFIFLEDHFSVGDYVTLKDGTGIVEDMGLRTTQVRDFNGDLHIIPNGQIQNVTNHSRGSMRALVDVGIAYEEDVQRAIDVLSNLCERIGKENKNIVEGPSVMGVQALGDSSVNIRIVAKTYPMEQWDVERQLRQKIKEVFDQEGIEIPYPKRVIYQEKGAEE